MRRRDFILGLCGAGAAFSNPGHAAEDYPVRPIRIVVTFPPGGGTDIVARIIADKLQASLGQPVVIDNHAGASGVIGTAFAAKAAPDGYTLLFAPSSHAINPSIRAHLPYDTVKDFAPVTLVASAGVLVAVNPRVPAHSMRELVAAAKAAPQSIATYGSAGAGTVFHLTGQLFNQLSGLALRHIPYRGGGPTVAALLAGEIPIAFETMLSLGPHIRAGTLRALAVTSARRNSAMPEMPTTAEAEFPALAAETWYALFAPAGTPPAILARLHDATVAALALPDVRDKLGQQGADPVGSSPAELAAYVAAEIPKWAALAQQAGVVPQ